MKTKKMLMLGLMMACWLGTSAFTVSKNTVVNVGKQTQLKLSNVDLRNDGVLMGDTASMVIISNSRERKISGSNIYLSSLKIDGSINSQVSVLSLQGDLIMESGVLNIGTGSVILYGELIGENDNTFVTASTGFIEKRMAYLPLGKEINVLGFSFVPITDVHDFRIIRSHNSIVRISRNETIPSAKRVYSFPSSIDITGVGKDVLSHEVSGMYKPTLFIHDYADWQKVNGKDQEYFGVQRVSIFSPDKLFFPKVIMPNSHTHSLFVVEGSEEYPNCRLVILNRSGQQLYDLPNYANDFSGENLPCGTYYYMFYKQPDEQPVQKSFFEVIR
jgi:hypothetical protein